jgi:hypothetical protein
MLVFGALYRRTMVLTIDRANEIARSQSEVIMADEAMAA